MTQNERTWPRPQVGAQRRLPAMDYADPTAVFFVTIRARRGTAPFMDDTLAALTVEALHWLRTHRSVQIFAFSLVPDHLHLLLRLDGARTLGAELGAFKSFTTRQAWQHGWKGDLWQHRFYDHVLRNSEDARTIAEYIRQNPVRRGLVEDPDAYPWSGLHDPM